MKKGIDLLIKLSFWIYNIFIIAILVALCWKNDVLTKKYWSKAPIAKAKAMD